MTQSEKIDISILFGGVSRDVCLSVNHFAGLNSTRHKFHQESAHLKGLIGKTCARRKNLRVTTGFFQTWENFSKKFNNFVDQKNISIMHCGTERKRKENQKRASSYWNSMNKQKRGTIDKKIRISSFLIFDQKKGRQQNFLFFYPPNKNIWGVSREGTARRVGRISRVRSAEGCRK